MKNIAKAWRSSTAFLLSAFSFLIIITSCSNELDEALQPTGNGNLQFVVSDFPTFGESTQTRAIGTQDEGKTAWENGDQIIVTLISRKYGEQAVALTYNGSSWSTEASLSYLENETPSVSVFYAPCYEVTEEGTMQLRSGMQLGMTEYLSGNYEIENGIMTITFEGAIRDYSRLRIAGLANQTLTVTTTNFTPAGATEVATTAYTLTTDENGNAYLYGTFAVGATVSVNAANIEIGSHSFSSATEECVSYALDAILKYFSVSAEKYVIFSPGNLQYHPVNNEWRFAESQTDFIGETNSSISSTYNGWIDSFGWSGNTGVATFGVSTSEDHNDYSGIFVDWGTNQIGDNAPNTWRTLSKDEWVYLFITRTNADLLYGIAQVKGVNGMVVLPDNWETPTGLTFKSGQQGWDDDYSHFQSFSAEQWSEMEKAGALFLPANGFRQGTEMNVVCYLAYYWSSTEMDSEKAYYMFFDYMDLFPQSKFSRSNGCSVRLVKDLQ